MKFSQAIKERCEEHARDPRSRFIGYNTVFGSRMYGTLTDVSVDQCVETPVAENLMVGLAMGLALEGYCPVVCFERHDFLLLALDALVNQMDKMPWLSGDKFKWNIVIRAIVGAKKPLNAGPMHTQNYRRELTTMLKHTPVLQPITQAQMAEAWGMAGRSESGAVVVIEHRDWYDMDCPAE